MTLLDALHHCQEMRRLRIEREERVAKRLDEKRDFVMRFGFYPTNIALEAYNEIKDYYGTIEYNTLTNNEKCNE